MPLKLYDFGVPTTVYHIGSKAEETNSPLFVLIPGNPGLAEYYVEYLDHLHEQMPEYEMICPSHIGFNTVDEPEGTLEGNVHSLDEQIEHKIKILEDLAGKGSEPRDVVIMGHSVGAWMVQRVVVAFKNSEKVRIRLVGLLTPTVKDIAKSEKGTKLMVSSRGLEHTVKASGGKSVLCPYLTRNLTFSLRILVILSHDYPKRSIIRFQTW